MRDLYNVIKQIEEALGEDNEYSEIFDEHFEKAKILYNYMPIEIETIGNIHDNTELLEEI